MRSIAVAAAACVALLQPARARACAACNCGDPTLTSTGVERPYKNRVRFAVDELYSSLTQGDMLAGEQSWSLRSSLVASWSPLKWLTLNARLPWVTSWVAEGRSPTQLVSGLGDLELSSRFLVFHERGFAPHHLLWLTGGVKAPTGYRVYDDQGFPFPDDDQPGSGSWDPFAGATYAWFSGGLTSFYATSSYRYTTPNTRGYRRGSTLASSAAVQLQPFSWGAIAIGGDVVWREADQLGNHADVPSTGGVIAYFSPALLFSPRMDLLIRVSASAPVVTHLYGQQTAGPVVALSIAYDVR